MAVSAKNQVRIVILNGVTQMSSLQIAEELSKQQGVSLTESDVSSVVSDLHTQSQNGDPYAVFADVVQRGMFASEIRSQLRDRFAP